ncbi:MAG TPA: D-2-hydroxyacid dehydrogenase [Pseudomonadales bacterium]|nr:D-2-hydroxyacid dehydrogenase [Pseudomonadales bacterium]
MSAETILILDPDAERIARALVARGLPSQALMLSTAAPQGAARDAQICLARPDLLAEHADALPDLRWAQSTWAGIRPLLPLLRARPELVVTGVKGIFGSLMAEYLFGWLAALERGIPEYPALQAEKRWQPLPQRRMAGRRMTLLGLGSIGAHLASVAGSFGISVTGVSRSGAPVAGVDTVLPVTALRAAARDADYLVSVVPDTADTRNLIDGEVLGALAEDAILVNVGRGSVLDEAALIAALPSRRPRAAVLDVFREEPLPEGNPLWTTPGVYVTPHVAATTQADDIAGVFLDNLQRWRAGEPLGAVVEAQREY